MNFSDFSDIQDAINWLNSQNAVFDLGELKIQFEKMKNSKSWKHPLDYRINIYSTSHRVWFTRIRYSPHHK